LRVSEACHAFIRVCEAVRKLSPHTIRAYELDLCRFEQFVSPETHVHECDRTVLHRYVEWLFSEFRLKETSAVRHIASLRSLFRWLEDDGLVVESPFRRARIQIRLPKRLPRILSRAELRSLLSARCQGDFGSLITQVVVELLFGTGIRVAELAALRTEDVDLPAAVITIVGKGDRQRRVYIPDDARGPLESYREARAKVAPDTSAFIVTSRGLTASPQHIRRLVRRLGETLKLERRVTPHMFRHSVATYLLEEGVDIRYVQRLLGHRSIGTTEIYTHVADAALKSRVIERHPRRTILHVP
jgi:site-specific recombinase XerD